MVMRDEVAAVVALRDASYPDVKLEAGLSTAFGCTLAGQVPEADKMDRLYRLIEVVNEQAKAANERLVGQVESVLVEGPSAKNKEIFVGRTRSNKLVHFTPTTAGTDQIGTEIKVRIKKGLTYTLQGEISQ